MHSNISLHGLGFIQVQLPGDQRVHVWHPSLPRYGHLEFMGIHNHSFDFESRVLVGSIHNTEYVAEQADSFDGASESYVCYRHEGERECEVEVNACWQTFMDQISTFIASRSGGELCVVR